MPHPSDPLWQWRAALGPHPWRLARAIAFGVLALGSALALAGLSAWLITRAWQMPPVLDLAVAVVAVRALGISRAIWRYAERLAGHDVALRGGAAVRERVYAQLVAGAPAALSLRSGVLLDRLGSDIDELAEVVVRSIVPMAVAAVLSVAATATLAVISPAAALVLGCALLVAGVLAPALAARAVRERETYSAQARSRRSEAVVTVLEHAPELRVGGRLSADLNAARRAQQAWTYAQDRATGPAALAAAAPTLATGVAVLGALTAAVELAGHVAPTTLAVLVLLPLAAFEATAAVPAAAVGASRARIAANRLTRLAGTTTSAPDPADVRPAPIVAPAGLSVTGLRWGTGDSTAGPLTFDLPPGGRLAIEGASGVGKTSLLTALAGLAAPARGTVRIGNRDVTDIPADELSGRVRFFAEDAHLFATTLRDNLLVARGDAADADLMDALTQAGLGSWVAALPAGLDTVLTAGASSLSGGQRRRLLLARAVLSPVPVLLLDEPTEHLDNRDSERLLRELLDADGGLLPGRTVVLTTHHLPRTVDCPRLRLGDTVRV